MALRMRGTENIGVLAATVTPENATDKTLRWSSSNEEIATVNNAANPM